MQVPRALQSRIVLIDGTFASLDLGHLSSIGRIYAALSGEWGPLPRPVQIHYAAGQQWDRWRTISRLVRGSELQNQLLSSYDWLARHWQPGEPIFLFGYSRGAFAVRSLAGLIGRIGLLRPDQVTDGNLRRAWRLYSEGGSAVDLARFRRAHCHDYVPIRMIGVFDTVVALGLRLPLLWMLSEPQFRFHDHELGPHVACGAQALALDETRAAFAPLLWSSDGLGDGPEDGSVPGDGIQQGQESGADPPAGDLTRIQQMWFRGCHPDIGGQLSGAEFARPLANIPLVWMLETASAEGLPLPKGWRDRLPCDASAPSVGSWRFWGKAFLARAPRMVGTEPTEAIHATVPLPYGGPAILTGALAPLGRDRVRFRRKARRARARQAEEMQKFGPPAPR